MAEETVGFRVDGVTACMKVKQQTVPKHAELILAANSPAHVATVLNGGPANILRMAWTLKSELILQRGRIQYGHCFSAFRSYQTAEHALAVRVGLIRRTSWLL